MNELWEILVPTVMDGKPIHTRYHRVWDKFVRSLSGGLTILKPVQGQWIHVENGEVVAERMIPVRIACSRGTIIDIMHYTKRYYKQAKVMAYKLSKEVIIE